MNGNPTYHAIALVAGTLLVLPLAVAVLAGWTPRGLQGRRPAARPYAWALLCLYALMPLNAVPRMMDAAPGVVTACTASGFGLIGAACSFFVRAGLLHRRTNRTAGT
ncbi:hypothetical protein [Streptomyces antarcticus]|uniref:hypothetical protein n=1 Tax=Streptomyces antarcticus TaxID=2996458 RepID=UPI00226FC00C|nr:MULTISPECIES: hypothetical protein [unclassified Streptomyces]MCY0941431.1 hypothetical protein [Streptomyces sp. H34-AA3]MCZ4085055.1 hypothetical protein [Streptomyces sp. H34-S5]